MIDQPQSFEQKLADAVRTLQRWCLVLSVAFGLALGVAIWAQFRETSDQHRTCAIQARGLPAGKQLAIVMNDLYKLLTPKPGVKQAANEPPSVKLIIADMTLHLGLYQTAEAKQPSGRPC